MKPKNFIATLMITASAIGAGTLAYANTQGEKNDALALLSQARVNLTQAIAAAETHTGGRAIQVELEKQKTGAPVYGVEVVMADHKVFDVKVDASNAKVLSSKLDQTDDEDDDD